MKSKSKLDEVLDGAETNFIKKMSYTDYLGGRQPTDEKTLIGERAVKWLASQHSGKR